MKIIKNTCFGGYSLSSEAKIEVAKRKGLDIYFFDSLKDREYKKPIPHEEVVKGNGSFVFDYTVPNPKDHRIDEYDEDGRYTSANKRAEEILIDWDNRTDPDIVAVVEEMGTKADGDCAKLEVVEIPDGTEYEIDEYDGIETIREKHRTW